MYQKILWITAAALLVGLGCWVGWVMPSQAWAQWDGKHWQIVAEGWAVLGRGWPLAVFGALGGALAVGATLAFTLQHAKETDFRAKIARLTRQRDAAVAEAESRVQAREQAAGDREAVALAAQRAAELAAQEAHAAHQRAEQAQQDAERAVNQAHLRARNAVCAAERIKRRIEGKKRLEIETSAP